jgi:uncharacterized protein YciI
MKEYLYRLKPLRPAMLSEGPTPRESRAVEAHMAYVKDRTEKGVIVMAGRTQVNDERSFGIVVFRADSDESARGIMNDDPAVQRNIMGGDLYPFKIAFMGKGTGAGRRES